MVNILSETNSFVSQAAAVVLGELGLAPDLVIPALTNKLASIKGPEIRTAYVYALGEYGKKSRPAVPGLLPLLNDPNLFLRETASNALQKIDPEALKRATQK